MREEAGRMGRKNVVKMIDWLFSLFVLWLVGFPFSFFFPAREINNTPSLLSFSQSKMSQAKPIGIFRLAIIDGEQVICHQFSPNCPRRGPSYSGRSSSAFEIAGNERRNS